MTSQIFLGSSYIGEILDFNARHWFMSAVESGVFGLNILVVQGCFLFKASTALSRNLKYE